MINGAAAILCVNINELRSTYLNILHCISPNNHMNMMNAEYEKALLSNLQFDNKWDFLFFVTDHSKRVDIIIFQEEA